MTRIVALLCLALAGASWTARAQDEAPVEHYFVLLGSTLLEADDKRNPQLDGAVGAEFRFGSGRRSGLGYELRAFYEQLDETFPEDTGNRSGIGVDALYRLPQFLGVTLYGLGGGGFVYSDALPGKDWIAPLINVGLGLESGSLFTVAGGGVRLRVEGRFHYEDNRDEYYSPTAYDPSNYAETRAYAGLTYAFAAAAAAPAAPVEVVPAPPVEPEPAPVAPEPAPEPTPEPAAPGDADGDGIPDDQDRCANSESGKPVDSEGCTILKVLTLKGVNFELNSDQLRAESYPVLDEAFTALSAEFPDARIEVAGHTDSTGEDAYNQDLSQRRAQTVRQYLIEKGIVATRLTATGYGETAPVADNATREGRFQNRRVELRVKSD